MPYKNEVDRKKYFKGYVRKKTSPKKYTTKKKNFLCFDGETLNDKYVLLGNSEHHIYNKEGISSIDAIRYLYFEGKGKIKVFFAMHYDVQMFIKDLPDETILKILNSEKVLIQDFEILYMPKKFLTISIYGKTKYIYDVSSFFQTSLLNTIDQMKIDLTDEEEKILNRGKKYRASNFSSMMLEEIIMYNKTECIVTEKICTKLASLLSSVEFTDKELNTHNICPAKFYGSGAVAKKILSKLKFQQYAEKEVNLSKSAQNGIYHSYYGGRAELFKIGTFKNVYKYDINSAYPFTLQNLRVLEKTKHRKYIKNRWTQEYTFISTNLYFVEWNFEDEKSTFIGILPFRSESGYVYFPTKGKGWYYGIECKNLNFVEKGFFKVTEEIEFSFSNEKLFPNQMIENFYLRRLELKEKKDFSQIAYKLSLNSLYGKLAQQTGKKEFTLIWAASYVTAYTRYRVLNAVLDLNLTEHLLQISTDGIFLDKEIKNLNISKEIGAWTCEFFNKGIFLGSGIYGLYGEKELFAMRGITVSKENFESVFNKLKKKNSVEIEYNCFIGHKFSIANWKKFGNKRCTFQKIIKTVSPFDYLKRIAIKKNPVSKKTNLYIYDIFEGGVIKESSMLKKMKVDLEEEIIQDSYN